MNYIGDALSRVSQSRVFQWSLNKVRENTYPFYYNHNAWEADLILPNHNVWLGGLASACDRSALRARGITRIITAVYDVNPIFPNDPELIYLKIPVLDKPTEEIAKHFDKAVDFIDESVRNGHGVLVHCVYGISRSSTLLCAYLMKKHNMTVANAVSYVKKKRPQVNPNNGFLLQLCSFDPKTEFSFLLNILEEKSNSRPASRPSSSPGSTLVSRGSSPNDRWSEDPKVLRALGTRDQPSVIPLFTIDVDEEC